MDCFTFDPIAFQDICPGCHSVFRTMYTGTIATACVYNVHVYTVQFPLSLLSDTLQKYQGSHSMLHCSIFVAQCSVH